MGSKRQGPVSDSAQGGGETNPWNDLPEWPQTHHKFSASFVVSTSNALLPRTICWAALGVHWVRCHRCAAAGWCSVGATGCLIALLRLVTSQESSIWRRCLLHSPSLSLTQHARTHTKLSVYTTLRFNTTRTSL